MLHGPLVRFSRRDPMPVSAGRQRRRRRQREQRQRPPMGCTSASKKRTTPATDARVASAAARRESKAEEALLLATAAADLSKLRSLLAAGRVPLGRAFYAAAMVTFTKCLLALLEAYDVYGDDSVHGSAPGPCLTCCCTCPRNDFEHCLPLLATMRMHHRIAICLPRRPPVASDKAS